MDYQSQIYRYRVDANDLIVWVDPLWLAFAQENGASELTEDSVLSRSLWEFVAGDVTRRLFAELHARVRQFHRPVVLPFRCDSPSLKRHMQLTITEEQNAQLLYKCVLLHVEPQSDVGVLYSAQRRSNCFLTMCSCCKRALLESVGWLGLEDVSARLRVFDQPEVPGLRYTVCPECSDTMRNCSDNGDAA